MPTYLVPVRKYENGEPNVHFLMKTKGNSRYEAMNNAMDILSSFSTDKNPWDMNSHYKYYQEYEEDCDDKATTSFTSSSQNDIISSSNHEEVNSSMNIYNYMVWGDYDAQIQALADKALPERWSFEGKDDNSILKNYLRYTFNRLQSENKVLETDTYCVFNTGLFTPYYVPIYAYGELNKNTSDGDSTTKWFFKGFKDEYELGSLNVDEIPERADYFQDPSLLIFNWHLKINVNHKHILETLHTNTRLPKSIKESVKPLNVLKGTIDTSIQKVMSNYKLAVPNYYPEANKVQLMIPLYFDDENDTIPDVALILDKHGNHYQATTCLTMDMAYMDARLIAKPESNWLALD